MLSDDYRMALRRWTITAISGGTLAAVVALWYAVYQGSIQTLFLGILVLIGLPVLAFICLTLYFLTLGILHRIEK